MPRNIFLMFLLTVAIQSLCFAQGKLPWDEKEKGHNQSILEEQLQDISNRYGKNSKIVVIHLGIDARNETAVKIRTELEYSLKQPVVVIPSYAGEPKIDLGKAAADYYWSGFNELQYTVAWQQILDRGYKINGIIFHSGSGIPANTTANKGVEFIKANSGKIIGPILFVNTDMRKTTRDAYSSIGIECEQIGAKGDLVSWATKPASSYVPYGDKLARGPQAIVFGPPTSLIGWVFGKAPNLIGNTTLAQHSFLAKKSDIVSELQRLSKFDSKKDEIKNPKKTSRKSHNSEKDFVDDSKKFPGGPPDGGGGGGSSGIDNHGDLGGIDFKDIEFRYFAEYSTPNNLNILSSAFRCVRAYSEDHIDNIAASSQNWNSLFVWLALPNTSFWVNLNPSEPDRIIDPQFGKTDFGKIMLLADLQLKKDLAVITHPKYSSTGKIYWKNVYDKIYEKGRMNSGSVEIPITMRVWIVPGKVNVCADDNKIYVMDAHLEVKLESDYLHQNIAPEQAYFANLTKDYILPELKKKLDFSADYAELRRVFFSRVIAEWYKNKHSDKWAFAPIVDNGLIQDWCSQRQWASIDIFNQYRLSFQNGEYSIVQDTTYTEGNYSVKIVKRFFLGGIDFTSVPMNELPIDSLSSISNQLTAAIYSNGFWTDKEVWLGGSFFSK